MFVFLNKDEKSLTYNYSNVKMFFFRGVMSKCFTHLNFSRHLINITSHIFSND